MTATFRAIFQMKCKPVFFMLLMLSDLLSAVGQEPEVKNQNEPNPFENKFHWGFSYNNYWSTITGSQLTQTYFSKPSIGFNLRAEYYFLSFLGVGIGAGYQQRGAGIVNIDIDKSPGNPDSTYRERLRFNTIEVPISLLLRTPKDVIKGIRLSGSVGAVPMINFSSTKIFLSVEDGNHKIDDVSADYYRNDLAYQLSVGAEIKSGPTQLVQVHGVYTQGIKNVYQAGGDGHSQTIGFRISLLF